ncbi:MAG TPA: protein kinase [Blastocatellia bacterium]|nr:protein kinase [Blastocatellia bacterium]
MSLSNLIGQVLDEKYRIEKQLGRGGMGAVYLATHLGTDRPVAVKVIVPQFMLNDEFVERFRREAKAAGRMRHPNVVDVTDFGFAKAGSERVAYLVMEYLDGCSLAEVLAEEARLPVDWVVDILEQACSAVEEAHRAGTIHRDLKPDNIWLEPNRRGGYTVKVLDFGLAKAGETQGPVENLPAGEAALMTGSPVAPPPAQVTRRTTAHARQTEVIEAPTQAVSVDESEAATLAQVAPASEEQATLILTEQATAVQTAADDAEPSTMILPPEESEADTLATPAAANEKRITNEALTDTVGQERAQVTASADGLTRVGSILGTPLYMSPEQCRSEPLDGRSDIYSLGVIAYQMLAGEPPFKGDIREVMRQHIESPPPPLREKRKKIPKRMAAIIMSALAKNPDERPASAATFASALRASSEGTGKLLRRAFALYSEHFPVFFRLAIVAYLPVFLLTALFLLKDVMAGSVLPKWAAITVTLALALMMFIANFISSVVITGVTIWFVVQLYAAPLRPLRLRPALRALKKRLKPFVLTTLRIILFTLLRIPLLVVPALIYLINSSLAAPVVIMENLKGREAVRRSKSLVKRARLTVIAILIVEWVIPALASSMVLSAMGISRKPPSHGVGFSVRIGEWMSTLLNVFFIPLVAMLTALLYLKVRQLGGERLKDMLDQFEQEEVPQTNWQKRMRERLSSSSHSTRSA